MEKRYISYPLIIYKFLIIMESKKYLEQLDKILNLE